jgi:metal transporter CNNM
MAGFMDPSEPDFAPFFLLSLACVIGIALAAGMTLGYFSIDTMKLKIKLEIGTPEEKAASAIILNLLHDRHLFLCTLLVFNVICAESLPIFMDELIPPWLAVILAVSAVLIGGEVIPAAIFT